jgi:hypothetical protein
LLSGALILLLPHLQPQQQPIDVCHISVNRCSGDNPAPVTCQAARCSALDGATALEHMTLVKDNAPLQQAAAWRAQQMQQQQLL